MSRLHVEIWKSSASQELMPEGGRIPESLARPTSKGVEGKHPEALEAEQSRVLEPSGRSLDCVKRLRRTRAWQMAVLKGKAGRC